MRRFFQASSAIAALALAAGSAVAQLDVTQPVIPMDEFGGTTTRVSVTVDPMLVAGNPEITNGDNLIFAADLIDADGVAIFPDQGVTVVGGPIPYANAATSLQVDLNIASAAINNPSVVGIQLKVRTSGGDGNFLSAPRDAANEANDEVLTAVRPADAPELQSVFISTDGMNAFFEFDRPLNVGAAGNDDNQTVLAMINDGTDFQFDMTDDFDGMESSPTGLSNPTFLGAESTIVQYDRNDATSDLNVGTWVRPNYDNTDTAQHEILSIVGFLATDDAVQAVEQQALTIDMVEALVDVNAGAGVTPNVIRVTYNLPLNTSDLGNDAFYGDFLQLAGGGDSTLDITNISAGASANEVLLEITPGVPTATDSILANGVNGDDGMSLTLDTDTMAGDVPSSIFTADDYDTDQSLTVTDAINPGLATLAGGGVAYKDQAGDGVQDGVLIVFNEPLDTALGDEDADDLGITLTRQGGVTLNPIGMIDDVTGVRTSFMTAASAMAADDEIDVTDLTIESFDVDGNGTIDDLEMNNAICLTFDPAQDFEVAGGGWDNDDTTTAGTGDAPGTGDDGAVQADVDADLNTITDANGVGIDTDADVDDTDDLQENTDTDAAAPVIVGSTNSYRTGDNFSGGFLDTFVETDGNVGDDDKNNVFYGIFSEPLTNAGDDPSLISWGGGATERFRAIDTTRVLGADNTILQIEDSGERGFAPGDTLTFSSGHMIDDAAGNEISGQLGAPDLTPPFVARQTDINGNNVLGAYLFDLDDDDFADEVRLFTSVGVDEATVQVGDFAHSGGEDFDTVAVNPAGTQITLTFAAGANISVSTPINVTYTAPANNDDMASQIIAGTDGNSVFPGLTTTIQAVEFPTPLIDTDDLAIMDIRGNITFGATPIGVGAKVYGMVAVPVPDKISFRADNVTRWVDDSNSLEAFFDFIFGIEDHLYAIDDDGNFGFANSFGGAGTTAQEANGREVYDISVNASNLERVTFQGQGRSYTNGDSQPERNLRIQNGEVTLKWDVLRSNGGNIVSFKDTGFEIDGAAIRSRAVVEDAESGAYALHVSAPITQFYGAFGQTGWPVIIVVEQATGERFAATSLLNATDNMGPLLFNPLQRSDDADTDNGRGDGSNVVFDIDLDNLGTETLYTGWQLLPFNRVSGYARSSGDTPTLPAIQGGDDANVVSGSDLPNDHPFNQFAFFDDDDDNGEWTVADDVFNFMDSLIIDVNCINGMWFTMDDNGVNIGNNVSAFIGGYGAGFHNGSNDRVGVFQFGAAGAASTVFPSGTTFSSSSTLDWAIVTAPAGNSDPDAWLSDNAADFLIEFNRISNTEVDVNTQGGGINDVMGVNLNQAYFTSFE